MKRKLVIAGSAMLLALSALAQNNGPTNNSTKGQPCCSACTPKCGCDKNCCTNGQCDKSKCTHEACSTKGTKSSK